MGGIDVSEPSADLGIALAVATCARDVVVDPQTVIIGEIGLSGEIHPVNNIEKRLNEAVMSDQEVYKTVLEWYKAQIEGGKMTLNQCYELLSDKAKVSLNKMVDQSKIRESMINKTINKLIKESIELNKKN